MANKLPYHPKIGEVLWCDYKGLVPPEMEKKRLAVVVSPKFLNRPELCTVIPLSTTPPNAIEAYHVLLDRDPDPMGSGTAVWAKCDMLMTVSFSRLSAYHQGRINGKRNYISLAVSPKEMGAIKQSILYALGLSHLWK